MVVPHCSISINSLVPRESGQFQDQHEVNYDRRTVFKNLSACDHRREREKVIIITSTSQTSEIGEQSEQTERKQLLVMRDESVVGRRGR